MSIIFCISKDLSSNFACEEENRRTAALGGWGASQHNPEKCYLGESKNKGTPKFMTCTCFSHGNPTVRVQVAFLDIHFEPLRTMVGWIESLLFSVAFVNSESGPVAG